MNHEDEEDIDYDSMMEGFLKGEEGQTLWVKAEDVDVRIGLLAQFSWMFEKAGVEEALTYIKAIERYIKYGE